MVAHALPLLNFTGFKNYAFSLSEVDAVLSALKNKFVVTDTEALRKDLTNDFTFFAMNRASQTTYEVTTRIAIDRLAKAGMKIDNLYNAALGDQAELTWMLNKAFRIWPGEAERNLDQIQRALSMLNELLAAPDARDYQLGMSLELQFIGLTLPATFEFHFHQRFGISRRADQKPDGPGVKFVATCLRLKKILSTHGKPYTLETIAAHRTKALGIIAKNPHLAVTRSPVLVSRIVVLNQK
jgi:hypothetical protein